MSTDIIAVIGTSALYLFFAWLASAILASLFSGEKGFGERVGLASGLILAPIGVIIWLLWPAKPDSDWAVVGPSRGGRAALVACAVIGVAGLAWSIIQLTGDDGSVRHVVAAVLSLLFLAGAVLGLVTARKPTGARAAPAT